MDQTLGRQPFHSSICTALDYPSDCIHTDTLDCKHSTSQCSAVVYNLTHFSESLMLAVVLVFPQNFFTNAVLMLSALWKPRQFGAVLQLV